MPSGKTVRSVLPPLLSLIILPALGGGCEKVDSESEYAAEREDAAAETASEVEGGWRDGRTEGVIMAADNSVEWETRNIARPPGPNLPGDSEWIIARIEGEGYRRLLIMTMDTGGGRRGPSRIYFEGPGSMTDNAFPMPLPGPSRWRVTFSEGALRVYLDGLEIWSARGDYGVSRAVMTDSGVRGFLGEWRPAP